MSWITKYQLENPGYHQISCQHTVSLQGDAAIYTMAAKDNLWKEGTSRKSLDMVKLTVEEDKVIDVEYERDKCNKNTYTVCVTLMRPKLLGIAPANNNYRSIYEPNYHFQGNSLVIRDYCYARNPADPNELEMVSLEMVDACSDVLEEVFSHLSNDHSFWAAIPHTSLIEDIASEGRMSTQAHDDILLTAIEVIDDLLVHLSKVKVASNPSPNFEDYTNTDSYNAEVKGLKLDEQIFFCRCCSLFTNQIHEGNRDEHDFVEINSLTLYGICDPEDKRSARYNSILQFLLTNTKIKHIYPIGQEGKELFKRMIRIPRFICSRLSREQGNIGYCCLEARKLTPSPMYSCVKDFGRLYMNKREYEYHKDNWAFRPM